MQPSKSVLRLSPILEYEIKKEDWCWKITSVSFVTMTHCTCILKVNNTSRYIVELTRVVGIYHHFQQFFSWAYIRAWTNVGRVRLVLPMSVELDLWWWS